MRANPACRSFVFCIMANWMRLYWTGRQDRDGKLERSAHRADAFKFPDSTTALTVAETHAELRDSEQWMLVPIIENKTT